MERMPRGRAAVQGQLKAPFPSPRRDHLPPGHRDTPTAAGLRDHPPAKSGSCQKSPGRGSEIHLLEDTRREGKTAGTDELQSSANLFPISINTAPHPRFNFRG